MTTSSAPPWADPAGRRPRTVVSPFVWSLASVLAAAIVTALPFTDSIPQVVVVVALGIGWPLASLTAVTTCFWIIAVMALAGAVVALVARDRAWSRPLGLVARTAATLPLGLVLPALFWQLGSTDTPDAADLGSTPAFLHWALAVGVVVVPLIVTGVRRAVARRTYGIRPVDARTPPDIPPDRLGRALNTFRMRLDPDAAFELAGNIIGHLQALTTTETPARFQFRMPNGAYLTITDRFSRGRRTLVAAGRNTWGVSAVYGVLRRPRNVDAEGAWFTWPVSVPTQRTLAQWCIWAFNRQDDRADPSATVVDVASPVPEG